VLDSELRMPAQARMLLDNDAPVLVLTCADLDRAPAFPAHVETVRVAADAAGRCDLHAVLELLARRQINDLMVEGGRTLCGALLSAGMADELLLYTAPVVLGDDALGMFAIDGLTEMAQRYEFTIDSVVQLGSDLRVVLRPGNFAPPHASRS
jgi:diaminohydroxyphosphoribosylaminopyrimidine deaminase/5-amino-6-(5-phosphoribosylamino)uracil reductase